MFIFLSIFAKKSLRYFFVDNRDKCSFILSDAVLSKRFVLKDKKFVFCTRSAKSSKLFCTINLASGIIFRLIYSQNSICENSRRVGFFISAKQMPFDLRVSG